MTQYLFEQEKKAAQSRAEAKAAETKEAAERARARASNPAYCKFCDDATNASYTRRPRPGALCLGDQIRYFDAYGSADYTALLSELCDHQ